MNDLKSLLYVSLSGEDSLPKERFDKIGSPRDDVIWVRQLLLNMDILSSVRFSAVRAYAGEPLPHSGDPDVVIVGGSHHSVNERLAWQLEMLDWLEGYRATGRPLLGICGGHQLVGNLFGSTIERLDEAPFAGSFPLTLSAEGRKHFLFEGFPDQPKFHFGNSDFIVNSPANSRVLASSALFETAALDHGEGWFSVQFHPEMSREQMSVDFEYSHPHLVKRFHSLPDAPKLLKNFFRGVGLL